MKNLNQTFVLALWILLLGAGFWRLMVYANTPGIPSETQRQWPTDSTLKREAGLATLLLFGHPRCPCTKASIGELERIMPFTQGKLKSYVIFVKPGTQSNDWAKEELWKKTLEIPEVETRLDVAGVEAAKFGASTSGQALLYDRNGELVFRGGITPQRGHMGDNDGRSAILSFFEIGHVSVSSTPVFGCSLAKPERAVADGGFTW